MFHKVDFNPKLVRRDKECHFILINGTNHEEEITIVKVYIPSIGTANFILKKNWT
jgi:hypothetical protein